MWLGILLWGGEEFCMSSWVGALLRGVTVMGVALVGVAILRNTLRTVEVWLDEYKEFYYQKTPYARGKDFGE